MSSELDDCTAPFLKQLTNIHEESIIPLPFRQTLFGRGPDCDEVLSHPVIGRRMAIIERTENGTYMQDVRGKPGFLFVDREPIPERGRRHLRPGAEVQIGPYVFTYYEPPPDD